MLSAWPLLVTARHALHETLRRQATLLKRKLPIVGNSDSHTAASSAVNWKIVPIFKFKSQQTVVAQVPTRNSHEGSFQHVDDCVAVEEPMEIRLVFGPREQRQSTSLSITMRTPGDDFQLALGFLVSEGIVSKFAEVESIQFCGPKTQSEGPTNITKITLRPDVQFSLELVQRHFYTTSSCGICGKASLDAVELSGLQPVQSKLKISAEQITALPAQLRNSQLVFQQTGGLHASGIFSPDGRLQCLKEDVGRHNALDKVVGFGLENDLLPWSSAVLVVSGRASFELVQKAVMAGFEVMIAVGAPSSLAVDLANRFGLTLIGFASEKRFNIYTHSDRVSF